LLRRELENPVLPPATAEPVETDAAVEPDACEATPPGAGAERTPVEAPPALVGRLLDGVVEPKDRIDTPEPELPPPLEGGGVTEPPLPPLPPEDDDPPPPLEDDDPPPDDDEPPPDEPPDDPPLVVRGMAWAPARAGVTNPTAATNDAILRTDLTMASTPGGPRADLRLA
jgi:hypothetical protein